MKKTGCIFWAILFTVITISSLAAYADPNDDKILTLEEAKSIALENNVPYKLQPSYIQDASENYEDVYESNSKTDKTRYGSIASSISGAVSREMAIENAALNLRKAVFSRDEMARASNYSVTVAYYNVIKSKLALEDAERNQELREKELDTARIKFGLEIITKDALTQAEDAYTSAQSSRNKAFTDLVDNMADLSMKIGRDLDVSSDQLDMTLTVPDVKSLDFNKIKVDYMNNNSGFYSQKEQLRLAGLKLALTQQGCDEYYRKLSETSAMREDIDDVLENAQREYDDARSSYEEREKDLDATLNNQYTSVSNAYQSYEDVIKSLADAKKEYEDNQIKYQLGILTKAAFEKSEANIEDLENQLNTAIISLITQYANITQYSLEKSE